MKRIKLVLILATLLLALGCKQEKQQTQIIEEPKGKQNIAYKWGFMAIQAQARDTERFKPRPTVTSRYLGLISVAMFDAWSRFNDKATPVYASEIERRPENEHTLKNKEIAVSYAAYRALLEYYYSDADVFEDYMRELGLDPMDVSMDPSTPVGIGNLAAKAVIEARKHDGSNQYGDEEGSNGKPYFDYTGYKPVNDADDNVDVNRWQPKYFTDAKKGKYAPGCLTPYWQLVKPVTMDSASQFRPGPPPMVGSEQLAMEVAEVVELQANLTDEHKALVEFMRDGPQSVQQAGHWFKFAQEVSIRDQHNLDEDVKMYFLNQITAMDAFIASWESKMFYDFARPFALVHEYYGGKEIVAWAGPGKGMQKMDGNDWRPYSPSNFLCPPFPSYTSGHSTISGACAEALKLYTGDEYFGASVELIPGSLTETDPDFFGKKVTLEFPTFTKTAEMAGISRVMGGYHIQADNVAGLQLGRDVAHQAWKFYKQHLGE
ncbi:vanadium-dependent haloperoxidase [Aestuariibaculum lutulentum]|uniref:Vanadium-dependent haloperoxidase n=1 Tax=Aestuariibaculum lutulentum TaxID=2920935 RepID=A0ABS9RLS0_9FLAO|nr:vanadium-dependent haloperoxidase [Aestuariibaculum lutulentum]MCH4553892.1 vanadium-dependent haloperoxidase [Aestuariibaculum lutulentum]